MQCTQIESRSCPISPVEVQDLMCTENECCTLAEIANKGDQLLKIKKNGACSTSWTSSLKHHHSRAIKERKPRMLHQQEHTNGSQPWDQSTSK